MALKYQEKFKSVDIHTFSKLLWGDYYFNHATKKFARASTSEFNKRTFVEFVLEPIYKVFSHTVGKDRDNLEYFLAKNLSIFLTPQEYKKNIKTMMKIIFYRYFKNSAALVQSCIDHLPSPSQRLP
jgi:U5 small nuclear ribonucleoprotein component